jgi:uncharacterized protein (TIGR03437 family)
MPISRTLELVCLAAFLTVLPAASPAADFGRQLTSIPSSNPAPQGARARLDGSYGKLPLAFEPNAGQTAPEVRFLTRGRGMTTFFTDTEAVMVLRKSQQRSREAFHRLGTPPKVEQTVIRMKLEGATKLRQAVGLEELPGVSNYFIGNDPKKWRTDLPHYARVRYEGVYPGIDLVWYGNQRQLEYDFVVAPGADPRQIQVAYEGANSVGVGKGGELVLRTALGEVRQQRPRVYQEIGGKRVEVAARYALVARNQVRFELAQYDRKRELRIDPLVLVYSTYLGGSGEEWGEAIAVDAAGSAYLTGGTASVDFPTQSPYQATFQGNQDAFVTKLTPAGNALVYSTYLGGSGIDEAFGIAVDGAGSAYVAGLTSSTNFPTQSPYQGTFQGGLTNQGVAYDVFVTKLTSAGNALAYSTYLGGGAGWAIAIDGAGSAYVTGTTGPGFPTQSPYQATFQGGAGDVFVTKLTPAGNALVYSTYLGGNGEDDGYGIAVDAAGSAYVVGYTASTNFPIQSPYQATLRAHANAFVTKLAPAGNALVYSTYLGGTGWDQGNAIAVDAAGSAYITGFTASTDFPTQSAYQATFQGGPMDAFVTKLTPAGTALVYSTYLGGNGSEASSEENEQRNGIAVDSAGSAYIAGYTTSTNFPTQSAYQATYQGGEDAFVTKLTPAGNALVYSTYLGGSGEDDAFGIAVDAAGAAYVVGRTFSTNFPTQSPYQATFHGVSDAIVAKLQLPVTVATNPPGLAIVVDGVTLTAPQAFDWASGTTHTISTTSPQQSGGKTYTFASWSDGGAQSHSITAPSSVTTYTAAFTAGPVISGVVDSAGYRPTIAPNSFVSIFGSNFTSWTGDWSNYAPGGVLPTTLGGVQVLIDGKNCFVSYASPTQVNVLTPLDTATGSVSVQVITAQGTATSTATMAQVAPALFGYTLPSGTFYAVAQIANTTTIVAPVGTFGAATPSRPAQAGDYLVLYAIGMGSTNPAAPSGVVLPTYYPVSDLSSVKVTFGSVPATVSWAGMVYAGEFQVNVQAPAGLSGDEPVVMTVGGQSTQPNAYLNFQ